MSTAVFNKTSSSFVYVDQTSKVIQTDLDGSNRKVIAHHNDWVNGLWASDNFVVSISGDKTLRFSYMVDFKKPDQADPSEVCVFVAPASLTCFALHSRNHAIICGDSLGNVHVLDSEGDDLP